ncbi:MAG: polyprenol monophosphomannose synthase [Candidatus Kerfeldbacteria bacterium]|nr:polyprenol monophosphomannose synthase [Candidatus Kerfeldbacteria bacterium]
MMPRAAIILPTYKEIENVAILIPRLSDIDRHYEVILIDDHSPDGTADRVRELAQSYPVKLLERNGKLGLASAVIDGVVKLARAPIVVVMDADLSHDERIIPELVASVEAGADVAIGSRFASGGSTEDSRTRRFFSWGAKQVARLLLGVRVQDPMSGFFAMRRDAFNNLVPKLKPKGFKILLDILVRLRPERVVEVGYLFRSRQKGESKLTGVIAGQYFRMIWDLWRDRR